MLPVMLRLPVKLLLPVTSNPPDVTVIAVLLVKLLTVTAPAADIVLLEVMDAASSAPAKLVVPLSTCSPPDTMLAPLRMVTKPFTSR